MRCLDHSKSGSEVGIAAWLKGDLFDCWTIFNHTGPEPEYELLAFLGGFIYEFFVIRMCIIEMLDDGDCGYKGCERVAMRCDHRLMHRLYLS